jgi:predicted RNase H-like HicB family nuclease
MTQRRTYTIEYEHDADGWWVASARGVKGCHTQGRTIEQARERVREALVLVVGDSARNARLYDNVKLPLATRHLLKQHETARARAEAEAERAAQATRAAVEKLTDMGLSTRDAGELLGLSRQRVNQILHSKKGPRRATGP